MPFAPLQEQCSVSITLIFVTTFYNSKVHSAYQSCLRYRSAIHTCSLLASTFTWWHNIVRISQVSHTPVSANINTTMEIFIANSVKQWIMEGGRGKVHEHQFSSRWSRVKRLHKCELGSGCSQKVNVWVKWMSLAHPSFMGSPKLLHDRLNRKSLLHREWRQWSVCLSCMIRHEVGIWSLQPRRDRKPGRCLRIQLFRRLIPASCLDTILTELTSAWFPFVNLSPICKPVWLSTPTRPYGPLLRPRLVPWLFSTSMLAHPFIPEHGRRQYIWSHC